MDIEQKKNGSKMYSVFGFEGTNFKMARWLSWLERRPVTAEVRGSNPLRVATTSYFYLTGVLAQLGEHLPYKQRVTGSSPVGPTNSERSELSRCGSIGRAADL